MDKPPFLIVRSPGATVMVNAESPAETRQLYRDLRSRLEEAHGDAGLRFHRGNPQSLEVQ